MAIRTRPWFYYFANSVLRIVFRLLLRSEIRGLHNVPRTGPLIIAISHSSFIDPLIVTVNIRRDITPMAKIEAFDIPILGMVIRWYGAFAVRRGQVDLAAFKTALQILENKQAMIIAPEGHRSESGSLQQGREGAIILSLRSNAPILPVAVFGGKPIWKNIAHLHRTHVSLHIGTPVMIRELGNKPDRNAIAVMTDELMVRIAEMMPESIRGYYSDMSRINSHYLEPFVPSSSISPTWTQQKEVVARQ